MSPELRKTHQQSDKAVIHAYGFSVKDMTESKHIAELIKMYQELTMREKSNGKNVTQYDLLISCPGDIQSEVE